MINEQIFFQNNYAKLNQEFGTELAFDSNNPNTLIALQMCFDLYESLDSFQDKTGWSNEEISDCFDCGTLYALDGTIVFFNDVNYDWEQDCAIIEDEELENDYYGLE